LDSTCLGSACDPGLDNKILIRIGKQLAFVSIPSNQTSSAFHCPGSINKQNPIQQPLRWTQLEITDVSTTQH
jgi:hypothetical protein